MNEQNKPRARRNVVQESLQLSADGAGRTISIGPDQNWLNVVASGLPADTGNVVIVLTAGDPQRGGTARGAIASLALGTFGVSETVHVPPGSMVQFVLDNFSGTGPVVAVATSWSEC